MTKPKVSVCIPSYNHGKFIAKAIESVLSQTFQDWEMVIADDASTDNTVEIIEKYQSLYPGRIHLIVSKKNQGPSVNGTIAHTVAKGEYLASLCSDDVMHPERLERQVGFLEAYPNIAAVFTDVFLIDDDGKPIQQDSLFSKPITDLRKQLLSGNFLNGPSAMIRKSVMMDIGIFNPALDYVQDFDYWLRILGKYDIHRMDEKLTGYRIHGNNMSIQSPDNMRYASFYETVLTILRAIRRFDDKLNMSQATTEHIIEEKYELAVAARNAEKHFLGTFRYAVGIVSMLILDILELDPEHEAARSMMNEIYIALGDTQRTMGKKGISFAEYQQRRQESKLSLSEHSAVDIAVNVSKITGIRLLDIAQGMMANNKHLFKTDLERESFIIEICQTLFAEYSQQLQEQGFYSSEQQHHLYQICNILQTQQFEWLADAAGILQQEILQSIQEADYQEWIKNHALQVIDAQIHAERMAKWKQQPLFQVIVFLLDGEEARLADTIDSLSQQFYPHWKLTVIADMPVPDPMFDELDVLEWIHFPEDEDPYLFLNTLIKGSQADWLMFAPCGIQFEPYIFLQVGDYIDHFEEKRLFYVDDDKLDDQGQRMHPRFKPDFNLDLLRSLDYTGVVIFQHDAFIQTPGFEPLPGQENRDLVFKFYEQFGEKAIGHIQEILIHLPERRHTQHDQAVAKQVVYQHLQRSDIQAKVEDGFLEYTVRVRYQHEDNPTVSIIIPTKDKLEFLRPCVESVLEKTAYRNYELIIVNNESSDPDTLDFLREIQNHTSGKVRVISYPHPFNYAAISNMAVEEAVGEYVLFLNNDTEVLHGEWLERIMSHAQRPDVGIVGARLVYPETGRLQHAGVILGMDTVADHPYNGILGLKEAGYMDRAQVDQNFSAVTGACLLIRKSLYHAVHGMDAIRFAVSYNDIDLCLKVREKGYRVVWTPYATLVHHGSVSQKSDPDPGKIRRFQSERTQMLKKWMPQIAQDPAYNRHLSLAYRDMRIETEMPLNWDVNFHDRTRVLGLPLSGGSGQYRIVTPFSALSHAGIAQCEYYHFGDNQTRAILLSEFARMAPDVVVFHAAVNDVQLEQIQQLERHLPDIFRIYTIDDLLTNVPEKSPVHREVKRCFADIRSRLRQALSACHRLIVSTQPLAELCQDMIDDIRVIPNRLKKEAWCHLTSKRNQSEKPRVGWAGAQQHQGDLEVIIDVVKETADEIDWIFMGMCPDELRPYIKEYHDFVAFEQYPEKLASLNLDLAIAPLEPHPFNEAKSNLRLLEYGILGWPVICSDIYPYRTNQPPVVRVSHEPQAWLQAIRSALADQDALHQQGDALKQWVQAHYILEDHLDDWVSALEIDPDNKSKKFDA